MKGDTRFIRTLQLRNLLSFGPDSEPIEFGPLNVLIGPNGSGKSNVIEAIDLLRASATDLAAPVRAGGGVDEWLWKGSESAPTAEVDATIYHPAGNMPLRHRINFTSVGRRFEMIDEAIENEKKRSSQEKDVFFFYRFQRGHPVLSVREVDSDGVIPEGERKERKLRREELSPDQSVISQRRDPDLYPEITYLGNQYKQFKLYREWNLGRTSAPRHPQPVDQPNDFLAEDASNLGLVLNYLGHTGNTKDTLDAHLTRFYEQYRDYSVSVEGGTVQVFMREKNLHEWVPASRLSDGTLRFLCLSSILCHPTPKPLICIEEPEIGLHPDILPIIAEMLVEASGHTQIIVTTYSDILVDALTYVPETVLVCEKERNSTAVLRLDQDELSAWLKEYSLGELWLRGDLGGNRW
ncbi:MAG: AAA family ATPase [Caldilineaceae bacterium]|nr:AAA family ATPase [Caldilineaceae bacterium]